MTPLDTSKIEEILWKVIEDSTGDYFEDKAMIRTHTTEIAKQANQALIKELEQIEQGIDGCAGYADAEHINNRLKELRNNI